MVSVRLAFTSVGDGLDLAADNRLARFGDAGIAGHCLRGLKSALSDYDGRGNLVAGLFERILIPASGSGHEMVAPVDISRVQVGARRQPMSTNHL